MAENKILQQTSNEIKRNKARNLRYKKSALAELDFDTIHDHLEEMMLNADELRYVLNSEGIESLVEAMDGDTDEAMEFQMLFSDLSARTERLLEEMDYLTPETFHDCSVALMGREEHVVGWDSWEEDYYPLNTTEEGWAEVESSKRLLRMTKEKLISNVAQVSTFLLRYMEMKQQGDYLKATLDILCGKNKAVLDSIAKVDELYQEAEKVGFAEGKQATKKFDLSLHALPDRVWIE